MKEFGIWILLTFALYYVIALLTGSKHPTGAIGLAGILALGVTLTFF